MIDPASRAMRVLVTRPEPQATALCDALERNGYTGLPLPLLSIEGHPGAADHPAWRSIDSYDWIVFTSANGVVHTWQHAGVAVQIHPGIAAVGPATGRTLEAAGATVRCTAPVFIAESLADALGDVRGKRVLWPRAAETRDVLTRTLRERGAHVDDLIVYATVPALLPDNAATLVDASDVVTFASPSAVRIFAERFGVTAARRTVCIGPVTASTAQSLGMRVDAIAHAYTAEGMLSALATLS
jgi:uroporphyrinogen-III synthase